MGKIIQIELMLIEQSALTISRNIEGITNLKDFEIKLINKEEIEIIASYMLDKVKLIKASLNKLLKIKDVPKELTKKLKTISVLNSQMESRADTLINKEIEEFPDLFEEINSNCYKIMHLIKPLIKNN